MWYAHPGKEGKMKITTTEGFKEWEKVGWGEGREAAVAKNRFMQHLEPLRGQNIGFQYDIGRR